ncbi:MAG: hypothetical protein AAGF12_06845 [Myxococcota bacterium]
MRRASLLSALLGVLLVFGCEGEAMSPTPGVDNPDPGNPNPITDPGPGQDPVVGFRSLEDLTADQTRAYMNDIVRYITRRNLDAGELRRIDEEGGAAIRPIIEAWTAEPGFQTMAREFITRKLSTSGSRDGIDFDLPGNLAAVLAASARPWSEIVTAESCYDGSGGETDCDTGAPYSAGVLTTRAFMVGRNGRFNLNRANTILGVFVCREYPVEEALQPPLAQEMLIEMFRASSAADQTDERALNGFGNGFGCYTCHSQFSAHAQLFVKFDEAGRWIENATGIQDPDGELGRSTDGLMASHFIEENDAASERSWMFGQEVQNLSEAAQVLADSEVFLPCTSQNLIQYVFGLDPGRELPEDGVAATVAAFDGMAPSFAQIVTEVFSHPWVVYSVVQSTPEESL